jgi:hypothetical protein
VFIADWIADTFAELPGDRPAGRQGRQTAAAATKGCDRRGCSGSGQSGGGDRGGGQALLQLGPVGPRRRPRHHELPH